MYLILATEKAEERNRQEALKRNASADFAYMWVMYPNGNQTALDVMDGNGLTDAEMAQCVDELPEGFIPVP